MSSKKKRKYIWPCPSLGQTADTLERVGELEGLMTLGLYKAICLFQAARRSSHRVRNHHSFSKTNPKP